MSLFELSARVLSDTSGEGKFELDIPDVLFLTQRVDDADA